MRKHRHQKGMNVKAVPATHPRISLLLFWSVHSCPIEILCLKLQFNVKRLRMVLISALRYEITMAGNWPQNVRPVSWLSSSIQNQQISTCRWLPQVLEYVSHAYVFFFLGYITVVVFAVGAWVLAGQRVRVSICFGIVLTLINPFLARY